MDHPRRGWRPVLLVVVAALAASTLATPAAAAPPPVPSLDQVARSLAGSPGLSGGAEQEITLVTGDTVSVRAAAGGRPTVSVRQAPRPDGMPVVVQTVVDGEHVYVLPSDAAPLVADGRLDRRLFDVRHLLDNGYAGAGLPLIVEYSGTAVATLAERARALPAAATLRTLESIDAVALTVPPAGAAAFWSSVAGGSAARAIAPSRVWLDGTVRVDLTESVPMVGAPQAWAGGHDGAGVRVAVLDTGVDATHPDLTDRVADARSFVPGETVDDGHGHGTHVASTVAGSGAASGGRHTGVAPGARLLIGKVLSDGGLGYDSWIIDGMEWAAEQGAEVVSMSLGGEATDGSDPLSRAVDELTATTGTLFVVAAGNSGPGESTVTAPGAADAALTVAAVDKSDQLAPFSGRGPRVADHALKPDIAAPGVGIAAARAEGTALGPIVDEHYTRISGTSMATPHVAGAAAILAQQHPGWTADQLKAALTSTARDTGSTAYEQGAGRLDVAAAHAATVLAETTKADFGLVRWPHDAPPSSRTVTYRNDGDRPVTLTVSTRFGLADGAAAPAGMLTVSPATVEVPAGGTADVTVTADATLGDVGRYSGAVLATADGVALRVPVALVKQGRGFDLTLQSADPPDALWTVRGSWLVRRVDVEGEWIVLPPSQAGSIFLEEGVYSVVSAIIWSRESRDIDDYAVLTQPQVELTADTTVRLDVDQARQVDVGPAGVDTESYAAAATVWHTAAGSTTPYGVISGELPYGTRLWATPTPQVTVGSFVLEHTHVTGTPLIRATLGHGRDAMPLPLSYQHYAVKIPKLTGNRQLTVVDAGTGSAAEFATIDVRGKVALVDIGDKGLSPTFGGPPFAAEELANAAVAGAVAVFAYTREGKPYLNRLGIGSASMYPVPTLALPAVDGRALKARLGGRPGTITITTSPDIRDVYVLAFAEQGAVPESIRHRPRPDELATNEQAFHSDRPVVMQQTWIAERPSVREPSGLASTYVRLNDTARPARRTEHIGPVSDGTLWWRYLYTSDLTTYLERDLGQEIDMQLWHVDAVDVFPASGSRREVWGQPPLTPGAVVVDDVVATHLGGRGAAPCAACRYPGLLPDGDLFPNMTIAVDGHGRTDELTAFSNASIDPTRTGLDEWHMYRDGEELPQQTLGDLLPFYVLPPGSATYELTNRFTSWRHGVRGVSSETAWTFISDTPVTAELPDSHDGARLCLDVCGVEPLIFLGYHFELGRDNTLPAPGTHVFAVEPYRQHTNAEAAPIAGLELSASFDGGATWSRAQVAEQADGSYRVVLRHPPGAGTVTLRTRAWDTAGNSVQQVIHDAYGLVSRRR